MSGYVWGVSSCARLCASMLPLSVWVCASIPLCVWVCTDICGCGCCVQGFLQVRAGVHTCVWVCEGVHGSAGMSGGGCVWDEFSEYLLETRVLISADFNTYHIQIFSLCFYSFEWKKYFVIKRICPLDDVFKDQINQFGRL